MQLDDEPAAAAAAAASVDRARTASPITAAGARPARRLSHRRAATGRRRLANMDADVDSLDSDSEYQLSQNDRSSSTSPSEGDDATTDSDLDRPPRPRAALSDLLPESDADGTVTAAAAVSAAAPSPPARRESVDAAAADQTDSVRDGHDAEGDARPARLGGSAVSLRAGASTSTAGTLALAKPPRIPI